MLCIYTCQTGKHFLDRHGCPQQCLLPKIWCKQNHILTTYWNYKFEENLKFLQRNIINCNWRLLNTTFWVWYRRILNPPCAKPLIPNQLSVFFNFLLFRIYNKLLVQTVYLFTHLKLKINLNEKRKKKTASTAWSISCRLTYMCTTSTRSVCTQQQLVLSVKLSNSHERHVNIC